MIAFINMPSRTLFRVAILPCILFTCLAYPVKAQLFGNKSGGSDLQKSVDSLQAGMMDMQRQLERIQLENSQMRGQLELLQKQSEDLQSSQRLYFKDVDSRLTKMEPQKTEIEGISGVLAPDEKSSFSTALKAFQDGEYEKADTQLSAFIKKYPDSPYSPVAMYWLGNSKYALKNYSGATIQFEKLIAQFPNHMRTPPAMLMMANAQLATGNKLVANLLLTNLVSNYPNSQAALEAKVLLGSATSAPNAPANALIASAPAAANPPSNPLAAAPTITPTNAPVAVMAPAETLPGCPPTDSTFTTFKPTAPNKMGDFVYIVSKDKQVVCVRDSTGKIEQKSLDQPDSQSFTSTSFFGKPPFLLMSNGLAQIDVFFQGQKVPTQGMTAKSIRLEQTEIPQTKN